MQNGGSVFGLQFSNPVDPGVAYHGEVGQFGKPDPLVGQRIGGVNVFGGGAATPKPCGPSSPTGTRCWPRSPTA